MIILNLVVGIALLVAGIRHAAPRLNHVGTSVYLSLLVVFLAIAFVFPGLIGDNGSYTSGQAALIAALTTVLYSCFLFRQMGGQRHDFQQPHDPQDAPRPSPGPEPKLSQLLTKYRRELTGRTVLLLALVVPIVLLSHGLADVLDATLSRLGAPVALVGILIAAIVFLPETVTALRAAYRNELQRVSNLCHGAAVSTVGLIIPAVLVIGLMTDQPVLLAESPTNLALLAITMVLTASTAFTPRVTALHGAAHVALFVLYMVTVFV